MGIPIQEILEVVFAGTIFAALVLALWVILLGGKFDELTSPGASFFFNTGEKRQGEQSTTGAQKPPPNSDQPSTSPDKLKAWFIGLFVLSLVYSLGVVIERSSDELKDGPAKSIIIPGKTDAQIRCKTFRKSFEDEWPEWNIECLPYSDDEIGQIYYTAVNFLKQREPSAQELASISRRIHFIESTAVLAMFGFYAWGLVTVALILSTLIYRHRKKKKEIKDPDPPFHNWSLVQRWAAIRFTRMFVMTAAFFVLFQLANYAWSLNEKKYNQLVFGYYLVHLRHADVGEEGLARVPASEWSPWASSIKRLEGIPETQRFDASGVAWLKLKVEWDPLILEQALEWVPEPRFVVVNDKDSTLTIHSLDGSLKHILELPEEYADVVDLEEITWARDDVYYLLASHSTDNQKEDPRRQRLYKVKISGYYNPTNGEETYSIEKIEKVSLATYLENTRLPNDDKKRFLQGWKEDNRDCCDINIEGMAVSPDSRNLLFGFREPLICEGGKPYSPIYQMNLDKDKPTEGLSPVARVPATLPDRTFPGPHRISGMAYDSHEKCYWILTSYERKDEEGENRVPSPCDVSKLTYLEIGPSVGGALWKWDGTQEQDPVIHSTIRSHKPEGIAVSKGGRMIIVFDNDDPNLARLGIPYAFFSLPGPGAAYIRPSCTPLLPRDSGIKNRKIFTRRLRQQVSMTKGRGQCCEALGYTRIEYN